MEKLAGGEENLWHLVCMEERTQKTNQKENFVLNENAWFYNIRTTEIKPGLFLGCNLLAKIEHNVTATNIH